MGVQLLFLYIRLKTCRGCEKICWWRVKFHRLSYEKAIAGASTERPIYSPSPAFSYVHICFSLFPKKMRVLVLRAPIVLKSHLLRTCSFWQWCVGVEAGDLCIQEAAYLQSKHCVVGRGLLQQHRCVQCKQHLTSYNNTEQICAGLTPLLLRAPLQQKKQNYSLKFHTQVSCERGDSNIQQVAYIAMSHIQKLRNSSANSFTSGRLGEDSTSSTLLRKVWVEQKGHHATVGAHGWALCLYVFVGLYVWDLCEVVGSVMRNGPVRQLLQEAKHWHGLWVLGALDLLEGTDD